MRQTLLLVLSLLVLSATPVMGQFCDPGFFGPLGMAPCTPCASGFFTAVTGSEVCNACPAGRYQPNEGSTECLVCLPGTFQALPGAAACEPCPAGYFTAVAGSAECQPCPPGFTSEVGAIECEEEAVSAVAMSWGLIKARYR